MNNVPTNVTTPINMVAYGSNKDIMKKLPWSLALAVIPFIPDILDTIRSIPNQWANNGYAIYVKHGQTEVHFNRTEIVGDSLKGDGANEKNN